MNEDTNHGSAYTKLPLQEVELLLAGDCALALCAYLARVAGLDGVGFASNVWSRKLHDGFQVYFHPPPDWPEPVRLIYMDGI